MASELTTCNICGRKFSGYGNNPSPILPANFVCCDECNAAKVIPARIAALKEAKPQ